MARIAEYLQELVNSDRAARGHPPLTMHDIIGFVRIEIYSTLFSSSPTKINKKPGRGSLMNNPLTQDMYFGISGILDKPGRAWTTFMEPDPDFKTLENIISDTMRPCFVKGESVVALDDDKVAASAKYCAKYGLAAKKIKKNFGPVIHTTASVLTQLPLGIRYERRGFGVESDVKVLLKRLCDVDNIEEVNLSGTLLTKDRGYTSAKMTDLCLQANAHELGTQKREHAFPFTFDATPTSSQRLLTTYGCMGAYFAESKASIPTRPTLKLHAVGFRQFGRVVLLHTTKPEHGTNKFHAVLHQGKKTTISLTLQEFACELEALHNRVRIITVQQRDASWFVLRRFRATSTTSS